MKKKSYTQLALLKIKAIRKEIAINVNENGFTIEEARKNANIKYGKGWRERGLVSNIDDLWGKSVLNEFAKENNFIVVT